MPTAPGRLVPDRPALEGLEPKWMALWDEDKVYRFDRSRPRADVFSIDTPPPTVSGSLHVGHVFSFTHTDIIARFQRMLGKAVFYPMGWDDNGLPTERRVQNYFGVRCDPSLPYDPAFQPPATPPKQPISISRPNFIELCIRLTTEDEKAFEALWRRLGLSVDWGMTYATIGKRAQRVSQLAFVHLLERGLAYQVEAPTLWDVDFKTAVAQAELEDREMPGAYHRIRFAKAGGADAGYLEIETTRPELIPACVALVAHPDDARYQPLFGTQVRTPLFGVSVPVVAHALADPEKGSGIAMICTFGDITDVTWWRELSLPVRAIIQANGTLRPLTWGAPGWESTDAVRAQQAYGDLAGLSATKARTRIVELLKESGDLLGEPRPITHNVKFFEKGDRPLEIVTSRQWFIKTIEFRPQLLELGKQLRWHPEFMQSRYESWVNGLNGDWCVSRQRFFGVPFPVWYPIRADGTLDHDAPIVPAASRLPIDPSTDVPDGYTADQRGVPGGFAGDPDVMDTWATSSLSPQIVGGWAEDEDLFKRVFPMDLRPQAHDIIRTWLFSTVLRSHLEQGQLPWAHAAISGWVLDPDRKKMSKSKGNVVTPMGLLEEHGADAVRYWAASGGPGVDTAFDPGQMRVGRRLAIKVLNASKFILASDEPTGPVTSLLDRGMLSLLARRLDLGGTPVEAEQALRDELDLGKLDVTAALGTYEYSKALQLSEKFFWDFCDDYLELVKRRKYGALSPEEAASANAALRTALSIMLRMFAPYLPFVTDEVWSWWQEGSIHRAPWPRREEITQVLGDAEDVEGMRAYHYASRLLGDIRREKSARKVSPKTPVTVKCTFPADVAQLIVSVAEDIKGAGMITTFDIGEGDWTPPEIVVQEPPPMSQQPPSEPRP
jgi:valyl-tRNA synthetase